jgi:hypothetical protein
MRSGLIAVGLIAALSIGTGLVSANRGAEAAAKITCSSGFKRAVVGGRFMCIKAGQRCVARYRADYARSGLTCRSGRLRKATASIAPASQRGDSRTNPVPLGQPGRLGSGWTVTVTGVQADATEALLAADPGNKPPSPGFQYVLVSVTARYDGAGSSHLSSYSSFRALGTAGFAYSSFNSFCGTLPAPNLDLDNPLVFSGGTISGYAVCWRVPKEDVSSLVMYYQPLLGKTQLWFALR